MTLGFGIRRHLGWHLELSEAIWSHLVPSGHLELVQPSGASWGPPIGPSSIGGPAGHKVHPLMHARVLCQLGPRLAYHASWDQVVIDACASV